MSRVLSYEEKDTWIHRLSGVTKLIFFMPWSVTSMLTYDTRILLFMLAFCLIIFKMSKTTWKQVGTVFGFIMLFLWRICMTKRELSVIIRMVDSDVRITMRFIMQRSLKSRAGI